VTPNHLKHINFYILRCLMHLCNWWSRRLQIWWTDVPVNLRTTNRPW